MDELRGGDCIPRTVNSQRHSIGTNAISPDCGSLLVFLRDSRSAVVLTNASANSDTTLAGLVCCWGSKAAAELESLQCGEHLPDSRQGVIRSRETTTIDDSGGSAFKQNPRLRRFLGEFAGQSHAQPKPHPKPEQSPGMLHV